VRRAALALAALAALAGCSSEDDDEPRTTAAPAEPRAVAPAEPRAAAPRPKPPRPLQCEAGSDNCRAAAGRIVYVERVDPDGDGDAHFVLVSRESITGPGISVIDVRRDLRPSPLPGPGDWISAVGPVYEGSYGQHQIEAVRIRVQRRD
jgi:hypothetical protein